MANEIQRLYFGSQASPVASGSVEDGTFSLYGFSADSTGDLSYNADAAAVQTALEGLGSIGSGNVAVSAETNGFTIEFQGALADTDLASLAVNGNSLKRKADSVSINTLTSGSASVNEVQQVDFGGATTGSFTLNGNSTSASVSSIDSLALETALNSIWGFGNFSVTGSGPYSVEFMSTYAGQDVGEMFVTDNSTDGSPSVTTLTTGVPGVNQVVQIQCSDGPTEGTVAVTLGVNSNSWACTETSPSMTDWTLTSGAANDWTFTCNATASNVSVSASESSPELRKSVGLEIVTVQDGSEEGGGGSTGAGLLLLGVG